MKNRTLFIVAFTLLIFFFIRCEKEEIVDHSEEVSLQIENRLESTIDTFKFHFDTAFGEDSLMITNLPRDQISEEVYFDDVIYRYKEKGDIFLIKKGRFVIEDENYYIANCFCDPGIERDTFHQGLLSLYIEDIDRARGNVIYHIQHSE